MGYDHFGTSTCLVFYRIERLYLQLYLRKSIAIKLSCKILITIFYYSLNYTIYNYLNIIWLQTIQGSFNK